VQASSKPADGLALAQTQVQAGAWLEALATLDRVLAAEPKHKQARLLHASILCRLDDPTGAAFEFGRLKSGSYNKAEWAAAIAPCNNPGVTK
jgi:Flp pilus assembly protein TadD